MVAAGIGTFKADPALCSRDRDNQPRIRQGLSFWLVAERGVTPRTERL